MKRLIIMAMVLVTASCAKESGYVTVKLDYAITGNTMTKVTTAKVHSAVSDAVKDLPVKMFYGKVGTQITQCNAGDVVSIPVGDVRVTMEYYGDAQEQDDVLFYTEPYFYADTTVAFHSYYSELTVRAHFKCAMVVVNPAETEYIYLKGEVLALADYGSFKAFYVYADAEDATTEVTVYAMAQTDFTERKVTINVADLEWGKWYMLSPTGITSRDAEMNFDIDGFAEGGVL